VLQEKALVKVHIDRKQEFYFYLPNQQAQLRSTAPYLKLEDEVMNLDKLYITCPELMSIGNLSGTTAIRLLQRWTKEGKLAKVNENTNPIIYSIVK
jgi:ribosomal protein S25